MNKHFKKHLEASYARAFAECARTGHKVGDLDAIFNSIAMATFAELIVRECAEVAQDFVTVENNKLVETIHISPWHLQDKIKEHFGVE